MPTELKKANYTWLSMLIAGNLVLYFALLHVNSLDELMAFRRLIGGVAGAGGVLALLVLLNGVIDPVTKARLIYLRWDDPLPGCRAFTVEAKSDPRIDISRLEAKFHPLPNEGPAQNSLWYELYRPLAKEPAVLDAHRGYLLGRDYTFFAIILLVVLGPLSIAQFSSSGWAMFFIIVLAVQCAVAWIAAAHYGRCLVLNVLALNSVEKT